MSKSFFATPRGCVVKQDSHRGQSDGYELTGFPKGEEGAPIVIRNCNLSEEDIVLPVSTLSSEKILYTFGQDFGKLQIMGTVFLGPAGDSAQGLGPVIQFFNENRIEVSKEPVQFSMPGVVGYSVMLTSLVVSQADPDINSHDFALGGIIAETT